MMTLEDEAVQVSKDLGDVVFVGALAVVAHVGHYRQTRDLDLAVATPINEKGLEKLGYTIRQEGGKKVTRTPGGTKLDIYTRDVGGISIDEVFETATEVKLKKGSIRVMGLEALLLAKLRASRPQDVDDIRQIATRSASKVRWEVVNSLASNEVESRNLRTIFRAISGPR